MFRWRTGSGYCSASRLVAFRSFDCLFNVGKLHVINTYLKGDEFKLNNNLYSHIVVRVYK